MVQTLSVRTIAATLALMAALLLPAFAFTGSVSAQVEPSQGLCDGIGFADPANEGCGDDEEGDQAVQNIISTIVNILSIVVGAVSVIMIIIGGLRYITSSGDSGNVQAAKNTILYAIVGLIIVVFAQVIVRFVVNRSTREAA